MEGEEENGKRREILRRGLELKKTALEFNHEIKAERKGEEEKKKQRGRGIGEWG